MSNHFQSSSDPLKIAVVGGGISGLAACYQLLKQFRERSTPVELSLLEASDRLGGVFGTIRESGYLLETGADMFITNKPGVMTLVKELGLESRLVETDARYRRSLILRKGRPVPTPAGFDLMVPRNFAAFLKTPLLSPVGKLRVLAEYFLPAKPQQDETLEAFVCRRFGREAFDRIIQPMIGGIYTADPALLSLRSTLPRFLEMEAEHGGLLRAVLQEMKKKRGAAKRQGTAQGAQGKPDEQAQGARYGLFLSFDEGMSVLQERLIEAIREQTRIRLNASVTSLNQDSGRGYWLATSDGVKEKFDAVLFALPASPASRILKTIQPDVSQQLGEIPYASAAIVLTGYPLGSIRHPLDAFGLVVPAVEKRQILAVSFTSRKFQNRAPQGSIQLRTFVGGAMQQELLQKEDHELIEIVRRELGEIFGVAGDPEICRVVRWNRAMPQYHLGHEERVRRIFESVEALPGIELTGNAFAGVGLPDVALSSEQAVRRLLKKLEQKPYRLKGTDAV